MKQSGQMAAPGSSRRGSHICDLNLFVCRFGLNCGKYCFNFLLLMLMGRVGVCYVGHSVQNALQPWCLCLWDGCDMHDISSTPGQDTPSTTLSPSSPPTPTLTPPVRMKEWNGSGRVHPRSML
jgi:hypothetical protein